MRFDSTHKDIIVGYIFNIKHLAFIGIGISTLSFKTVKRRKVI